ncbi:MAG TPA: phosphotransferase [Firmicutes bacterium]|nr:phosphotransferase [Bacillota bacterium]
MAPHPKWSRLPLKEMLAEYGLNLEGWEEVSSCLKVQTSEGLFRLKPFAYPQEEFPFVYELVRHLNLRGFRHPESIRPTLRGQLGLSIAGRFYYLAAWQEGNTDFELNLQTLRAIGSLLGSFHTASRGFHPAKAAHPARIQWGAWPNKLARRCRDLRLFLRAAQQALSPFDRLFAAQEKTVLAAAEASLNRLQDLPYEEIVRRDQQAGYVCHRDCIPRNVVQRQDGRFVLIDFDNASQAERIDDLAKLIRTFSGWQLERVRLLLEGYGDWFPVTEEEIQLIGAFLAFPMEYWQLGKTHYLRGRSRLKALRKQLVADGAKAQFLLKLERNPERVMSSHAVFPRNPG